MSDESAFRSELRIVLGDDPTGEIVAEWRRRNPGPADPGGPTDATDPVLAALRRRIVDPVVAALLRSDEVDELTVRWGAEPLPDDVWVQLVARGELFEQLLCRPGEIDDPIDPADIAANLASNLEDFIAESRFGWGQQRIARYELPPAPDQDGA